jgi:hypothetical protein
MNKYEQLIEFIINEQEDKARELFHTIVVEKSREVYESLIDEQDLEEIGGNQVEQMVDEITMDEQGVSEEDEMGDDDMGDNDMGDDDMSDGDMDMGDEAGNLEDKVMSLEDELESLKAKFAELMGEPADGEMSPMDSGMDDEEMDMDMEVGMDDEDEMEGTYMEAKAADKAAAMKNMKKDVKKDAKKMTEAEWIREYVEKVSAPSNQEGADNTKAVVAPKNDMGGKVVGGSPDNADPKGTPSNKPSGLLKAGSDLIGKTQNSPGANAGKTSFSSKAPAAKSSEESGTNDKSPLAR